MSKWIFLLLLPATPAIAFNPTAKFKAIYVRNPGIEFLQNPFIEKCFLSKDLPQISTPKVQVATDNETAQNLYTIDFNGSDLEPRLVLQDGEKVELEKSSDKKGFILSLLRPLGENKLSLKFEIKNSGDEYIEYSLEIDNQSARFQEHLTNEQAQRICIRNQLWIGIGMSALSYDQKIEGIDASSKFTAVTPGSYHVDFRYYLNSQFGFLGSYKFSPGKIKSNAASSIDSVSFNRTISEVAFQWRSYDWLKRWRRHLIYPYLRGSYQIHDIPRIFVDDVGDSTLGTFRTNQISVGAGVNVFNQGSFFYEAYLNLKYPTATTGINLTPSLHFDGAIGLGKSVGRNLNFGLFWHGHYDKFKYSTTRNGFENIGSTTVIFSNIDLKLGWTF